jgi:hypothetical protein
MSLFSRLFGGGGAKDAAPSPGVQPELHEGYEIFPEPQSAGGQFRVAARIEKVIDGERKVHRLVRADTVASRDDAVAMSVTKAKQVIREQGDRLFG